MYKNGDGTIAATVVPRANDATNSFVVARATSYFWQGQSPSILVAVAIVSRKLNQKHECHADSIEFGTALDKPIK